MPIQHCPCRQRGTILIESLVALTILSLGAAAMLTAFDHLQAASHAARTLGASARSQLSASGTH